MGPISYIKPHMMPSSNGIISEKLEAPKVCGGSRALEGEDAVQSPL